MKNPLAAEPSVPTDSQMQEIQKQAQQNPITTGELAG